jgi:predicted amidohydrolase YtcJ
MKLWKNGIIHSMVNEKEVFHQMATHNGYIVGFDDEINDLAFDEMIDLKKSHVYPGFVDAHMHLLGYGQMLSRYNLSHFKQKNDIISFLKTLELKQTLFALGYIECGLNKDDLNQVSDQIPILIRHNDYHSLTVNDFVLKELNMISKTGVLTEQEAFYAMSYFEKFDDDILINYLKKALNQLYKFGITGAHSDDLHYFNGFDKTLNVIESVLKEYPFRANLLIHHLELDPYISSKRFDLNQNKYLQLGAIKMFYDGTISSKTALMKDNYKNTNSNGLNVNGYQEFESILKTVRHHNLTAAIHVIGDKGLEEVIDLLEKYPPKSFSYDRLIHTPWVTYKAIEKLKKLPLSIDIQPQFLSSDLPWALDFFSKTPELCFPWKTMLDHKIILSGSSDAPVEIPNPLLGIYQLIERKSSHDQKNYFMEEKLSRFDAISLYTIGANFQTFDDKRGYIKKGYIADFSIFKYDLLSMHKDKFLEDIVKMTVIDEIICYESI